MEASFTNAHEGVKRELAAQLVEDWHALLVKLKGWWFYVIPIVSVLKAVLSLADFYSDVLVTASWFQCGEPCARWAYCSVVLLAMASIFAMYRSYFLTVERNTVELPFLVESTLAAAAVRMLLAALQLHHVVFCAVVIRWWWQVRKHKLMVQSSSITPSNVPEVRICFVWGMHVVA
jgi:hypothetical protein